MKPEQLLTAMTDLDDQTIFEAKYPAKSRKNISRRAAAVLVAAILLMAMTITACANPNTVNWFRTFFHTKGGRQLTDGQLQYIDENTVAQNQSQTCNGYTITVDSAISDGAKALVKMTLTAPEGEVLDADWYSFRVEDAPHTENGKQFGSGSYGWINADDDNKEDNTADLLLHMDLVPAPAERLEGLDSNYYNIYYTGENLNEHIWTIRITDVCAVRQIGWKTPDYHLEEKILTDGVWEFQIKFAEDTTIIELIDEPAACPAEVKQWPEEGDEEVLITSLKLRALGAEMQFTFPEKGEPVNADFGNIHVVMKDGCEVSMRAFCLYPNNLTFTFSAPIALEEVSHVLLPNGTEIPMP